MRAVCEHSALAVALLALSPCCGVLCRRKGSVTCRAVWLRRCPHRALTCGDPPVDAGDDPETSSATHH